MRALRRGLPAPAPISGRSCELDKTTCAPQLLPAPPSVQANSSSSPVLHYHLRRPGCLEASPTHTSKPSSRVPRTARAAGTEPRDGRDRGPTRLAQDLTASQRLRVLPWAPLTPLRPTVPSPAAPIRASLRSRRCLSVSAPQGLSVGGFLLPRPPRCHRTAGTVPSVQRPLDTARASPYSWENGRPTSAAHLPSCKPSAGPHCPQERAFPPPRTPSRGRGRVAASSAPEHRASLSPAA